MIKVAQVQDMDSILAMCRSHHDEQKFEWPFSPERISMVVANAIYNDDWLCLTGPKCLLIARIVDDCEFGSPAFALERIFRSSSREYSSQILDYFEDWAKSRGCDRAILGTTHRHDAFQRMYRARGYDLAETLFCKKL